MELIRKYKCRGRLAAANYLNYSEHRDIDYINKLRIIIGARFEG